MAREIERKFLVRGDAWRLGAQGALCRQGYLRADVSCLVRVRIHGEQAFLAVKSPLTGVTRLEYEYEIPPADAVEMLERLCPRPWIEKLRYRVRHAGREWVVDEFLGENEGLVLAEIELEREEEALELPPWLGPEVSEDPRYFNMNLAQNPCRRWKSAAAGEKA